MHDVLVALHVQGNDEINIVYTKGKINGYITNL